MAQLMPLPLTVSSVKCRLVLPFWYWLTWVVPDRGPLNGVCVIKRFNDGPDDDGSAVVEQASVGAEQFHETDHEVSEV